MSDSSLLHRGMLQAAERTPNALAVACGDGRLSYGELAAAAHRLAETLARRGVCPGDRVGILLGKSIDAIIASFGVLQAGAVYVPTGDHAGPTQQLGVLRDCGVRAFVATSKQYELLVRADAAFVQSVEPIVVPEASTSRRPWYDWSHAARPLMGWRPPDVGPDDPAYILYTSGSTGEPKGVVLSHRGATSFVDWAVRSFDLGPTDRLANHASLSFDLSVLDVFAGLQVGASVHLLTFAELLRPAKLVHWLAAQGITSWYSVPTAITALLREGRLEAGALPKLRRVLFAGEVFPVPHLRAAMQRLPEARFANLYGPTETNVCTYHPLASIPPENAPAIPIGRACDHLHVELRDDSGRPVAAGQEGEICVSGPSVMLGYWGREAATRSAFWPDAAAAAPRRWYRTGDLAYADQHGDLWLVGRRDRQVKRRGYRIELGAVEAALAQLAGVQEAAVVASPDPEQGVRITAWIVAEPGASLGALQVKVHCGTLLPRYMTPDAVELRSELPRTSTGKVDRTQLGP